MKHEELLDRHSGQHSRLAQLLLEGRTAADLTQTEAAQKIGVTPTTLSRLEHGVYSHPSLRILVAAAEAYKMPQADLFSAAGYLASSELPSLAGYLHATCKDLPESAIGEIVDFCDFVKKRHGQN